MKTITDLVETEVKTTGGESFYGLYNQALPAKCFSSDGRRLVLATPQQNEVRAYVVDIGESVILGQCLL